MSATEQQAPSWEQVHASLNRISTEWSGCPLPLPNFPLTIERRNPYYGRINGVDLARKNPEQAEARDAAASERVQIVNCWFDHTGAEIYIFRIDGKIKHARIPKQPLKTALDALGVMHAWPLDAESKAVCKLAELIGGWKIRCYMTAGLFVESSPRSKITYVFRRLRPTLAVRGDEQTNTSRILCGLCLHPIGHYEGTFCGAMVPTDNVIAHLLMMRGDENKFWAQSGQHPPDSPLCGL